MTMMMMMMKKKKVVTMMMVTAGSMRRPLPMVVPRVIETNYNFCPT
jgi:hypothetical protein